MRYYEIIKETVDINSQQFKNWFNGSKVVDSNGQPLLMYHGWQSIDMDDKGIQEYFPLTHFGTKKAANNRLKDKFHSSNKDSHAIYPVYLSIKNPLRIIDDGKNNHDVDDILLYITFGTFDYYKQSERRHKRYGKISIEDFYEIRNTYPQKGTTPQSLRKALINCLKKYGYDGMVYKNRVEHRGSDSWIIFDDNQVWSLYKSVQESKLELPSIETGDTVMVGKFKNRKATIKGFATDSHNQPILKTDKGNQKLFKPRIVKLMNESIKLTDIYDYDELHDETERLYNYIDDEDLKRDFTVRNMSPQEARTFTVGGDNTLIMDAYKNFASREQKRLVKEKMKYYDYNRIVVVMNKTIIDGNHQIVAGILAKQPIKYIDLAEYLIKESNENVRKVIYYHVTATKNLPSIKQSGLIPKIGTLSTIAGESKPRIYLFKNLEDVEHALENWLGDYISDDEQLALLKISLPKEMRPRKEGFEYQIFKTIQPENIEILSDDIDNYSFEV